VADLFAAGWRTIDQLDALVGGYCWVERHLFELTGEWASAGDSGQPWDAELRVFFAAASLHHADVAARWSERLAVRADVVRDALVVPPSGPLTDQLSALDHAGPGFTRLSGLVRAYLPCLVQAYSRHLAGADPASEAPAMAVLGPACRSGSEEVARGQALFDEGVQRGWFVGLVG